MCVCFQKSLNDNSTAAWSRYICRNVQNDKVVKMHRLPAPRTNLQLRWPSFYKPSQNIHYFTYFFFPHHSFLSLPSYILIPLSDTRLAWSKCRERAGPNTWKLRGDNTLKRALAHSTPPPPFPIRRRSPFLITSIFTTEWARIISKIF